MHAHRNGRIELATEQRGFARNAEGIGFDGTLRHGFGCLLLVNPHSHAEQPGEAALFSISDLNSAKMQREIVPMDKKSD